MGKKQELREQIHRLEDELEDARFEASGYRDSYNELSKRYEDQAKTLSAIKRENERLTLTPEHKANVEAAYNRGFQAARRNLRAWGVSAMADLDAAFSAGDERTPDTTFQHEIFRTLS
jgi:chromosome segregation ATPase